MPRPTVLYQLCMYAVVCSMDLCSPKTTVVNQNFIFPLFSLYYSHPMESQPYLYFTPSFSEDSCIFSLLPQGFVSLNNCSSTVFGLLHVHTCSHSYKKSILFFRMMYRSQGMIASSMIHNHKELHLTPVISAIPTSQRFVLQNTSCTCVKPHTQIYP